MRAVGICLLAGAASVLAGPAVAQEDDPVMLDEIVVTAGRTPAEARTVGRSYTIITSDEIERSQARMASDVLRLVPGLAVSQTGNTGGLTQVRIRGAEGNHTLVLIDGIEAGEVSQGEFDFGGLLAADIERIEVIRGPQSAFWGSNATAGVINIITKGGRRNSFETRYGIEGGTDGTAFASAFMGGGGERTDFAVSGAFRRNDGFNISDLGDEKDGDRNGTLNAKFNADILDNLKFAGTARHVNRRNEGDRQDFDFPPTPTQGLVVDSDDILKSEEFYGSAGLTGVLLDGAWTHNLKFTGSAGNRDNLRDDAKTSASEGYRLNGIYQNTITFDEPSLLDSHHSLTTGIEFEHEAFRQKPPVFDPSSLDEKTRDLVGYVGEYRIGFADRLFLTGAARYDDNDAFKNALTYSISAAYDFQGTATRLHGSLGKGVTNPTFFEQFGFIPASFQGNPDLKPEHSVGWDIGIEQGFFDGRLIADITYFNQDLEDEITTVFTGLVSTPVNLDGTSKRQGVEVTLKAQLFDGLSLVGTYTYLDAEEPSGLREVRRPEHMASLYAGYLFMDGKANLFADLVYNGRMSDLEFINATPQTRVTLDDYVLLNIGAGYKLTDNMELYVKGQNLLHTDYEEVFGYNTGGVTGFLGARITLGGPSS